MDVPLARDPANAKNGIGPDGNYYDPWGRQYIVRIDSSYSGKINAPDGEQLDAGVIAWSLGPDGQTMICSWK